MRDLGLKKLLQDFVLLIKESGTVRLVRTACNSIHRRGSQKAGVHIYFAQYLRDRGIDTLPLAAFHGNRLNIVFYDAAGIYYLHEELTLLIF